MRLCAIRHSWRSANRAEPWDRLPRFPCWTTQQRQRFPRPVCLLPVASTPCFSVLREHTASSRPKPYQKQGREPFVSIKLSIPARSFTERFPTDMARHCFRFCQPRSRHPWKMGRRLHPRSGREGSKVDQWRTRRGTKSGNNSSPRRTERMVFSGPGCYGEGIRVDGRGAYGPDAAELNARKLCCHFQRTRFKHAPGTHSLSRWVVYFRDWSEARGTEL